VHFYSGGTGLGATLRGAEHGGCMDGTAHEDYYLRPSMVVCAWSSDMDDSKPCPMDEGLATDVSDRAQPRMGFYAETVPQ